MADQLAPSGYVRETAEGPSTGTVAEPRMLTEDEAYAVSAANVKRETAAAEERVTALTAEKAALETKVEAGEVALATEKARADAAEKALTDFKAETTEREAAAARTDDRTAKVKEIAKHVKDDFFTPERAARWAAMDDEAFTAYLAELAALAPVGTENTDKGKTGEQPPRETAATGKSVEGAAPTGSAAVLAMFPHAKVS